MNARTAATATCAVLLLTGVAAQAKIDGYTPSLGTASFVPEQEATTRIEQIRTIRLVGVRSVSINELQKRVERSVLGKSGDQDTIRAATAAVVEYYRSRRYTLAQVIETDLSPDGVLTLTISEGIIRRVLIQGNTRTKTATILRTLSLGPGQVFNEGKADADRQRLARLGIFADVKAGPEIELPGDEKDPAAQKQPDTTTPPATGNPAPNPPTTTDPLPPVNGAPTPPPAPVEPPTVPPIGPVEDGVGQVDLIIRVRETQTANIAATVGYADGMGAVGFVDVSENNLFGMAHRGSIQWQRTSQAQLQSDGTIESGDSRAAFSVSYEIPTLGPRSFGIGLEVYDKNTVFLPTFAGGQETIRSYERRRGFSVEVGRPVTNNLTLFVTSRRDEVGYDAVPDRLNPPISDIDNSFGVVGAFGLAALMDGRDNVDNPSRGYRHMIRVERATTLMGGTRLFTQVTADLRGYVPLTRATTPATAKKPRPVLALRLWGGTSSGDVPLSEQFFLGGFDLLRGYDLFSIRGDRAILGTAEMRVPLSTGLQGVLFSDCGSAWAPGNDVTFNNLKLSLGAGIRFLSPIGPIRLDAAYGNKFQTYISLGQSF